MLGLTGNIEDPISVWDLMAPKKDPLVRLTRVSKRIGSWFRKLTLAERILMETVILVVEKIRSHLLLKLLAPIVMKLLTAIMERFRREDRSVGPIHSLVWTRACAWARQYARKIGRLAASWGNKSAKKWYKDETFIECLAMNRIYSPPPSAC